MSVGAFSGRLHRRGSGEERRILAGGGEGDALVTVMLLISTDMAIVREATCRKRGGRLGAHAVGVLRAAADLCDSDRPHAQR